MKQKYQFSGEKKPCKVKKNISIKMGNRNSSFQTAPDISIIKKKPFNVI